MVKKIVLAEPRGFCAGVNRAIEIVNLAFEKIGPPIFVRHEIVHNHHVVNDLKNRGVVFVESLDEVPDDGIVIFSAHGTAPNIIKQAEQRGLKFIDAVCPLVTKVHIEIIKALKENKKVIYIGHRGHQEVLGAMGHSDQNIFLVENKNDVINLSKIIKNHKVIVATQTTLSVDDTQEIVQTILDLFPEVGLPNSEDICYATQNRQDAVRELVKEADHILIIGSENSSNTLRLVELSKKLGCQTSLISDPENFELNQNFRNKTIGISSGASAPEFLVDKLISKLLDDETFIYSRDASTRYQEKIKILEFKKEKVFFPLPKELNLT